MLGRVVRKDVPPVSRPFDLNSYALLSTMLTLYYSHDDDEPCTTLLYPYTLIVVILYYMCVYMLSYTGMCMG
jgi:hypothetical protein